MYKFSIDESNLLMKFDKVKTILKIALKRQDLFDLEFNNEQINFREKDDLVRSSLNTNLSVKFEKINNKFCSIKVKDGIKPDVTIILPLN